MGIQLDRLTLRGAWGKRDDQALPELPVPGTYQWVPATVLAGVFYGVAQMYARLAEGIRTGRPVSPSFHDAEKRHRLLDTIQQSADR